jgi:hypothetical protein
LSVRKLNPVSRQHFRFLIVDEQKKVRIITTSQARENDPEQDQQAQQHEPTPQTHQHHHISSHKHNEMDMATFHDQMTALAYKNTPESSKEAYDIAEMLLERAELPLEFRVRAHIVLACGKTAYLHHAQEAVRFAEMGRDIYGPGKTSESRLAVEDLLWEARETLRHAERDMEELKDLKKRIKAGEVKLKKGEKLTYGNINGMSFPQQSFPCQSFPRQSFFWQSFL